MHQRMDQRIAGLFTLDHQFIADVSQSYLGTVLENLRVGIFQSVVAASFNVIILIQFLQLYK